MFAKSLVVFVAVGAAAGLAFGFYLMDVRSPSQPVFVAGPSLFIATEKLDFKKDENIKITIINSGTVPLTFPDASYGLRITGLSGMLIYDPGLEMTAHDLEPHQEVELVWNQTKNDGDKALEGIYRIQSVGTDPQGRIVEKSIIITIWK